MITLTDVTFQIVDVLIPVAEFLPSISTPMEFERPSEGAKVQGPRQIRGTDSKSGVQVMLTHEPGVSLRIECGRLREEKS
jgi:hypothetical protein